MLRRKAGSLAEAIAPGAAIADVAPRHDLAPQHLSNWIRAAKDGRFALPADGIPAFVPVVSMESTQPSETARECRFASIEIVIGAITVRVPSGAEARDIEAVSPVVLGLFGRIVPSDAITESRFVDSPESQIEIASFRPLKP